MRNLYVIAILTIISGFIFAPSAVPQERNGKVAVKPLVTLHGENSKIAEPKFVRITSEKDWKALWYEHKYGSPDSQHLDYTDIEIDFEKMMVVAVFGGKVGMTSGYPFDSGSEDRKRIILRLCTLGYQMAPNADGEAVARALRSQPWGIYVFPRSDKEIVLERDDRRMLNQPAKWVKWKTLPARPPSKDE
jgi:hypothetical protein